MISPKRSENSASKRPSKNQTGHIPVLLTETLAWLSLRPGDHSLDLTVGGGGHAAALLEATGPAGKLIGFDADPDTLAIARERLRAYGRRVHLIHANFRDCRAILNDQFPDFRPRAVLLDLGLSSLALGAAHSRFSFLGKGPLDFRFDPTREGTTAADLVNTAREDELIEMFRSYGEEPEAKRIARAIIARRKEAPIHFTQELSEVIVAALPKGRRPGRIHPATRSFQALRIAVNDELGALEQVLPDLLEVVPKGGRLAVLSYHSLEDRIVKHFFRNEARDCLCPAEQPTCTCGHRAKLRVLTPHPIIPSPTEQTHNPRSRSAKLRVAERIA